MAGARRVCGFLLSAAAIAVLAAAEAAAQPGRLVDDAALKNIAKTGQEWLSYGLDLSEMRYSPLKQIDSSNINRLGLAWSYDVGPGGSGQQATPLVSNGIIYGITNWSITFAVDARTGKELWRWDPKVDRDATRPKICCGIVNRGIALYEDKVYVPVIDGHLTALDAKTGKPYWVHDMLAAIWGSPMVIDGKVYLGDEDGDVVVMEASKEKKLIAEMNMGSSVYSTPVPANGALFIVNRNQLFALANK